MNKKVISIIYMIVFGVCAILGTDLGSVSSILINKLYPEYIITNDDLFTDKVNLKDFNISEDGILQSTSLDPWIYVEFKFDNIQNPKSLHIDIESATNENEKIAVYFVDSYKAEKFILKRGLNYVSLKLLDKKDIGIRIDLTASTNEKIKVGSVTFNDNRYLTREFCQKLQGCLIFLLILGGAILIRYKKRKCLLINRGLGAYYILLGIPFACQIKVKNFSVSGIGSNCILIVLLVLLILLWLYNRMDIGFFFLLYIMLHAYLQYSLNDYPLEYYLTNCLFNHILALNVLFVFSLLLSLQKLVGQYLGNLLFTGLFGFFAIANLIKMKYQNSVFALADLRLMKELFGIAGQYIGFEKILVFCVILLVIGFIVIKFRKIIFDMFRPRFQVTSILMITLTGFFVFLIVSNSFKPIGIDVGIQYLVAKDRVNAMGIGIYSFLEFTGNQKTNEPDGYGKGIVEEVMAYKDDTTVNDTQPTVILILAESLFEVEKIQGVSFNTDLLCHLESYKVADMLSCSYGGRTSSAEFEALTGLSNIFIEGENSAYNTYLNQTGNETGSLAREFNAVGYNSYAIHANTASYYDRDVVYKNMGFNDFISKEDFELSDEDFLNGGGYVNDKVFVNKIIETLESDDNPMFIFGVSLECHAPYVGKYDSTNILASLNITVRRSRQSGVARATCPD